jgi:integrase
LIGYTPLSNVRKYLKTYIQNIDITERKIHMNKTPNQIKDVQPIRDKQQIEDMKLALKRFCGEREYILFILGISTGLRIGDLLKLKVKDIKKKTKLMIQEGKTSKPRTIHLECIYDELQSYIAEIDSEWLFPSRKGG